MVTYTCNRCLCEFNRKTVYERHINRKFKCDKINDDNSQIIKMFDEQLQKNQHDETLYFMLSELKKIKKEHDIIIEKNIKLENENEKLIEHIDNIKNNKQLCVTPNGNANNIASGNINNSVAPNGNINNGNINNGNINNFNIVAFGKEKMDFPIEDIVKLCQGNKTVSNMINHAHFNENMPENHNVYMPNRKNKKEVFVYDGEHWMIANKKDIVEQLIDKGVIYIEGKIDELKDKLSKSKLNAVQRAIDIFNDEEHENNKEITKKITEEVELILYNKKNVVIDTKTKMNVNLAKR